MITYRKTVDLYINSLYSFFNPFTPRVLDGAEFCEVTLTFEYVDETLWSDHSNETSLPVLTHGATCFFTISQNEIWDFLLNFTFGTFASERVNKMNSLRSRRRNW